MFPNSWQFRLERCILMAPDTGSLVIDPMRGSRKSACASEQGDHRRNAINVFPVTPGLPRTRILDVRHPWQLIADNSRIGAQHGGSRSGPLPKSPPVAAFAKTSSASAYRTFPSNPSPMMQRSTWYERSVRVDWNASGPVSTPHAMRRGRNGTSRARRATAGRSMLRPHTRNGGRGASPDGRQSISNPEQPPIAMRRIPGPYPGVPLPMSSTTFMTSQ